MILTFVAAIVALFDPRDESKSGLAAITPVGYVAAAAALVGLVVGAITTRRQSLELQRERERTAARRRRALGEIGDAVDGLFWTIHRVAYFASDALRRERPVGARWDALTREDVVGALEEFDMVHLFPPPHMSGPYAFPLGGDRRPLVSLVTEESRVHRDRLDEIVDRYGDVLEAGEIPALEEFARHPFLKWMTELDEQFAKLAHIEDSDRYLVQLVPRHVRLGGTRAEFLDFVNRAVALPAAPV